MTELSYRWMMAIPIWWMAILFEFLLANIWPAVYCIEGLIRAMK